MKKLSLTFSLLFGLLASHTCLADTVWSSFSVSYLNGDDYEVGPASREVVTIEYASAETWGDQFFFVDRVISPDESVSSYFEWAPRINLAEFDNSLFKNVSIATTLEAGSGFNNYLIGLGTSLNVDGFNYLTANIYKANNDKIDDDYQLTLTWGLPFKLGQFDFLFDGFIDYSSSSDSGRAELLVHPQVKWDLSQLIGLNKSKLFVGIEYDYWRNKFGIAGVEECNPNLLVKFHY